MSKEIEFQDVIYTVKERHIVKESKKKYLLQSVSGSFKNGQLSAIMGPSGAGKSSLLNAISGLRKSGVSGHIIRDRKASCYLTQEDHHQTFLSVEELMKMSCQLKLKSGILHEPIIEEILVGLNLNHRREMKANHLSGGERRRLSIALELVANPSIFYLDEPTSGLDEVTALQCIRILRNLAKQGKTVICTIHQPSPIMFSLFDQVYILANGQCVYQGEPQMLVPFLAHLQLECPRNYTPTDYIIEICDTNDENVLNELIKMTQNGKLRCCSIKNNLLMDNNNSGGGNNDNNKTIMNSKILIDNKNINSNNRNISSSNINNNNNSQTFIMKNAATSMILDKHSNAGRGDGNNTAITGGVKILETMKALRKLIQSENTASNLTQFKVLLNVMMLKIFRNKPVLALQFFHHVFCGTIIGMIFFKSSNEGERMFDHLKLCLGLVFFFSYTQMIVPILAYPSEMKLVKKECFNRWYSIMPYYFAFTISRMPFQIFFNLLFLTITYWMTGLPNEAFRFGLYILIGMIVSFVAEGLGLAIGSTFNITNGTIMGPLVMAPLLGLAIYGFDFAGDISLFMYALMKLSYIRVGIVSIVLCIFGYDRAPLLCNDVYCHFDDPKVLLRFVRIEQVNIWNEIGFLILYLVIFRTLFYISLKRRVIY